MDRILESHVLNSKEHDLNYRQPLVHYQKTRTLPKNFPVIRIFRSRLEKKQRKPPTHGLLLDPTPVVVSYRGSPRDNLDFASWLAKKKNGAHEIFGSKSPKNRRKSDHHNFKRMPKTYYSTVCLISVF